ncbi:MAG: serine hydrolase domain-containing protein [Planctomycetota bacterium]
MVSRLACIISCLTASVALGQHDAAAPLDEALQKIVDAHNVPGLTALLMVDGEVVQHSAVGLRAIGKPEAFTPDDLVHIGSCTKAMTATLAAMLVEEGLLTWDSTIGDVLTTIRDDIHAGYRDATLRQLLAHRAGMRTDQDTIRQLWMRYAAMPADDVDARLEAVRLALMTEPAAAPGERFDYANLGYIVAASMMEQVTGTSWETLMRQRLFTPLGMESAGFGPPGDAATVSQPFGHRAMGTAHIPMPPGPFADNPAITGPAGNVHCSLVDWAKFALLHSRGAQGADGLPLEPASFDTMHQAFARPGEPEGSGYALGWGVSNDPEAGVVLQHAGSNTMWFAVVTVAVDKNAIVLTACNAGSDAAQQACAEASIAMRMIHAAPKAESD